MMGATVDGLATGRSRLNTCFARVAGGYNGIVVRLPIAVAAFTAIVCLGQNPVPIPFACTADDIDRFGLTCSPERPCPVYADLNSVESVGARIFVTGNLHTEAATLYSLLFASEDSGATWKEAYERLKS